MAEPAQLGPPPVKEEVTYLSRSVLSLPWLRWISALYDTVRTVKFDKDTLDYLSFAATDAKVNAALAQIQDVRQIVETLPPPRELKAPRYGVFYDTTTQSAAAINTATAVTFNTTDLSFGVARGTPTSRIIVDRAGVYDFQFSAQLDNTSGGNHTAYIWCRVNGIDVANSASRLVLKGTDGDLVAAWNFVLSLKANDYFELMFSVSDTAVQLVAAAAAAPVPAIPSVILTVTNNITGQHT